MSCERGGKIVSSPYPIPERASSNALTVTDRAIGSYGDYCSQVIWL
jgi:hypothetical protein